MLTPHAGKVRLVWTAALVIAAVIWVVFAHFLVPVVIAKAYRGESLTIFNRLITGQASHPLTEYLTRWSRSASKVSSGLAVLGVYILFAVVGLSREATVQRSEPRGQLAMSKARLLVVYGLGAMILGGSLPDIVRDTEHWPFSQYQMFSQMEVSKTYSTLRLYGVVERSPLVEVQLDSNLYLQPFDNSRLLAGLQNALGKNRLDEAVTDCLTRYEALRRAGRHDGPPLLAMRLYMVTWTLDPSASNIDRPDRKELLTEVPARREAGD